MKRKEPSENWKMHKINILKSKIGKTKNVFFLKNLYMHILETFEEARTSMITRLNHNDTESENEAAKRRKITKNQERRANTNVFSQNFNLNKAFDQDNLSQAVVHQVKLIFDEGNLMSVLILLF